MRLPEKLKSRLRATRQWLAIALPAPQQEVEVQLRTAAGEFAVTTDHAVAALRPFTIRIGLNPLMRSAVERAPTPQLRLIDRALRRVIGVLDLHYLRTWSTAGAEIGLFEVAHGRHYCAPWPRPTWDTLLYRRAARRSHVENPLMAPAAVEQMLVLYLCPRPVHLVSVDDGRHSNLFPMDLVGSLLPERFTLALRNTSASVEAIKNARRVALSDVPGSACQIAYDLGAHHKRPTLDWHALPFEMLRSREFSLPVPKLALRVRELEILDFQTVGSHTLFVGRVCSAQPLSSVPQLFHTCGIHQRWRRWQHRAFLEA